MTVIFLTSLRIIQEKSPVRKLHTSILAIFARTSETGTLLFFTSAEYGAFIAAIIYGVTSDWSLIVSSFKQRHIHSFEIQQSGAPSSIVFSFIY